LEFFAVVSGSCYRSADLRSSSHFSFAAAGGLPDFLLELDGDFLSRYTQQAPARIRFTAFTFVFGFGRLSCFLLATVSDSDFTARGSSVRAPVLLFSLLASWRNSPACLDLCARWPLRPSSWIGSGFLYRCSLFGSCAQGFPASFSIPAKFSSPAIVSWSVSAPTFSSCESR
jgi:hypothetical protein